MGIFRNRRRRPIVAAPAPIIPFHDPFEGDLSQWEFETGEHFLGEQNYTLDNASIGPGGLIMVAKMDRTSARLVSKAAPFVRGSRLSYVADLGQIASPAVWPALWAIGKSLDWPRCGEVDVMECGLGGRWAVKQTVHTAETYALAGDEGWGPGSVAAPMGLALYVAEWDDNGIHFAVNGVRTGSVAYSATQPLRLVMNIALRPGVPLEGDYVMRVREVAVDPI